MYICMSAVSASGMVVFRVTVEVRAIGSLGPRLSTDGVASGFRASTKNGSPGDVKIAVFNRETTGKPQENGGLPSGYVKKLLNMVIYSGFTY